MSRRKTDTGRDFTRLSQRLHTGGNVLHNLVEILDKCCSDDSYKSMALANLTGVACDLNGDGYDDILIGTTGGDPLNFNVDNIGKIQCMQ